MARKPLNIEIEEIFGDNDQALNDAIREYYFNQPAKRKAEETAAAAKKKEGEAA